MMAQTTSNAMPPCSDPPLPPAFTPQDEMHESATLGPTELTRAEADLRGITLGMAVVGIQEKAEDAEDWRTEQLYRLDSELAVIPDNQKMVYLEAVTKCPGMVNDERKIAFLEREGFNAKLAAQRLARYWETKLTVFGHEKCFLPLTLRGAMNDEVAGLLKYCPFQVLPVKDTAGRAIIFYDASRRDVSEYSTNSVCMAFWYMVEAATEDPEVRKKGIVILGFGKNHERKHFDPASTQFVNSVFWDISPVACRSCHACHPSFAAYYLYPVLKRLMGKRENRLRLKIHYGTTEYVLKGLESYCLPRGRVPSELGGDVTLDLGRWLNDRVVIESQWEVNTTPRRVAKRMRSEKKPTTWNEGSKSVSADAAPNIECQPIPPLLQADLGDKRRKGRKGDPRMDRAVMAKLANPTMSSTDALLAGGFEFPRSMIGGPPDSVLDSDNVSLQQRRNQLSRRTRQEKKKEQS